MTLMMTLMRMLIAMAMIIEVLEAQEKANQPQDIDDDEESSLRMMMMTIMMVIHDSEDDDHDDDFENT